MTPPTLTILTVTKAEHFAIPFLNDMAQLSRELMAHFVIGLDGDRDLPVHLRKSVGQVVRVQSNGYLESVLETVVKAAPESMILRLDDDERVTNGLFEWLLRREYRRADHWKFPRVHLWGDEDTALVTPHLWPDWQTRLSSKAKSVGRNVIHAGSPFGGGEECPFAIEHHKFLVKDHEERRRIAGVYDRFNPGYGTGPGLLPFSLPELAYGDKLVHLLKPRREVAA
jgi:hypothetical protein